MINYSTLDKIIHKLYLKNYFLSKATLDFEIDKFHNKLKNFELEKIVFVSGLARSGTTTILREIHETNVFASLQYDNMPFLFLPNTIKNHSKSDAIIRSHNDGIFINGQSPEEFDEYFWKAHLNDSFIYENSLNKHIIEDVYVDKYLKYIKLICISKNKTCYLSKNNNNILRISSLSLIPNTFFFFLIRRPDEHASSLHKLHLKYLEEHKKDNFSVEYFDFLGHHEFGRNHKPFYLIPEIYKSLNNFDNLNINYWLVIWKQYYEYLLFNFKKNFNIIFFEDLISKREEVFDFINKKLETNISLEENCYTPKSYTNSYDLKLLNECNNIYEKFKTFNKLRN